MERLMRGEKASWKGFTEAVTFELSFKTMSIFQIQGKRKKKDNWQRQV